MKDNLTTSPTFKRLCPITSVKRETRPIVKPREFQYGVCK